LAHKKIVPLLASFVNNVLMKARGVFFLIVFVVYLIHHSLLAETSGDWTYSVTDNQATITGYSGAGGAVEIPAEVDGVAVVKVGDEAFKNNTSVTSITIPDSVTSIGDGAFTASDLTSITIPDSVTSIGDDTFFNCTSLASIIIPDSVTSIGDWAFAGCTSLTSVTIPNSVTSIGDFAFVGCVNLTSITIGNSVESIGTFAFDSCTSLTSIVIPDSVTSIGFVAFYRCTSLASITVDADNLNYSSVDGVLFNKLQTSLITYPAGGSDTYSIPDSVTSIGTFAFDGCTSLTSITIPENVTSIGDGAFTDCTSLTRVTLPKLLVGDYESFGLSADQLSAWTYTVTDNQATITGYSGAGGAVEIPAELDGIAVVKVGDGWPPVVGAFDYTVTSIIIPDSVTSIGDDAFSYCNNLTSITIPDSVTIIGQDAFRFCSSLTSLTIPNSVTTIGDTVFAWCTSLTNITVDADNLNYSSVDGVLFNKLQTSLITYPAGGSFQST